MNIKTKAINALDQFLENIGLMRAAAHEEFRGKCEEFAKDYMMGSSGLTVGGVRGRIKGGHFIKQWSSMGAIYTLTTQDLIRGW